MDKLFLYSEAKSRAINAENPTGEKGGACRASSNLGVGWKGSPCINIEAGKTAVIADINGPGQIESMWFGGEIDPRIIIRFYWEGEEIPSVECPLNAFFAYKFTGDTNHFNGEFPILNSMPVVVAPCRGLNCFWQMPFLKRCKITLENTSETKKCSFYQINYKLEAFPDNVRLCYFHAKYKEENPVRYKKEYTVLDTVCGMGHYVGTALFATLKGKNSCWVEGEPKFYIDNDRDFPTIAFTGIEDYFGGSFAFSVHGRTHTYSTPYCGLYYVEHSDGTRGLQHDSYMGYRWHIKDPIHFQENLRVTVHDLGWNDDTTLLEPRCDCFSSVAYWYQVK